MRYKTQEQCKEIIMCTAKELAHILATNIKDGKFIDCNFAIADEGRTEKDDLKTIRDNSYWWFGAKKIDTGFDLIGTEIVVGYFGGMSSSYMRLRGTLQYIEREILENILGVYASEGFKLLPSDVLIVDSEEPLLNMDNFLDDREKMHDFFVLTKEEFLESYSYLQEYAYNNTASLLKKKYAERIDDVLSAELSKIYNELGINNGSVFPNQVIAWNNAVSELGKMFMELIFQNATRTRR